MIEDSRLREELALGRTPIREALQRLAHENLVSFIPHRGTFVPGITLTDLRRPPECPLRTGVCSRCPRPVSPGAGTPPGHFRVGVRVAHRFGLSQVEATIVEDRGNLGMDRRRLYGVKFRLDDVSDEIYTEVEFDALTLIPK